MKKINNSKLVLLFLVFVSIANLSCQKEITNQGQANQYYSIANKNKIVKFLSVTLGVSEESIRVNYTDSLFYIPNTVFKVKISEIQKIYESANEYKANYEN